MHVRPVMHRTRDPLIGGLVLVIIGIVLLVAQFTPDIGRYVVLVIGLGLLGWFVATRTYGALVGGSIVTGVGAGVVIGAAMTGQLAGAALLMALGLGFLAIWVVSYLLALPERHFWPLVPGSILFAIGGALAIGGEASNLLSYWPVLLIALGLVLIALAYVRSRRED